MKRKKEYATDVLKREIEARKMKLKPCPFCGGEAECIDFFPHFLVKCKNCGANTGFCSNAPDAIKDWNKRTKESYDSRIDHCPVCQTLCEIKNCYEDENIYKFEPLVSFTPSEIQFITDRLEELIEEWDVPDMVFTAHELLRKLEKQQLSSK